MHFYQSYGRRLRAVVLVASLVLLSACSYEQLTPPRPLPDTAAIQCMDPRPQICTQDYRPVCAIRDTGVRCATEPCESTELRTYSNACSACSDSQVLSHVEGACEAPD
jgi:hypothetical protein